MIAAQHREYKRLRRGSGMRLTMSDMT